MLIIGGMNLNLILFYIDYDVFLKNFKIMIGYLDVIVLLLVIYIKIGIFIFYGLVFVFFFGEFEFFVDCIYKYFVEILLYDYFFFYYIK